MVFRSHRAATLLLLLASCRSDFAGVTSIEKDRAYQDPALLKEAWKLPAAASYKTAGFQSQENGSLCGPTSVVDAMASLGQPGTQRDLLAREHLGTFGRIWGGLTLDAVADILKKEQSRPVRVLRDLDPVAFRAALALANDPSRRVLVNFHRGPLFGRGHGHHSPVGGYLADRDLVFVLDVNHDYQPWLVKADRLLAAVDTVDSASGKKRGLIVLDPAP